MSQLDGARVPIGTRARFADHIDVDAGEVIPE